MAAAMPGKSLGVVDAMTAQEADAVAVLVGDDALEGGVGGAEQVRLRLDAAQLGRFDEAVEAAARYKRRWCRFLRHERPARPVYFGRAAQSLCRR